MIAALEQFLKEAIGLHVETVGTGVIDHAVRQRMSACGIADAGLYWEHLTTSGDERQALIDAIVIPETWFFRDREAFAAVAGHLRAAARAGRPSRLLSLPCSTGEEPFSIAMSLFDAGFGPQDFRIDAVDVSAQSLMKAERAVYGRNSFRGADLGFRDRYFEQVGSGAQLSAKVRAQVSFTRANLFEWTPAAGPNAYDAVFCRNLLIYFDRQTQDRALHRLGGWLAPGGLLLVGPGESGLPAGSGYVSLRAPRAFAFRKAEQPPAAVPPPARKPAMPPGPPRRKLAPAVDRVRPQAAAATTAPGEGAAPASERGAASLAALQQAADSGRIGEAKQAAAAHLAEFGPSPELFYLMGLVHDASGAASEAIGCYRKALYLAPDHPETLSHLALLLRRQGDVAGAKALGGRLARIEKGSGR
ncbi:CheR family methyltransferase [Labrys monachus]|uniref:Chemotaxis protein methyltransferase WspC n=1 Tax=Labrys monachus TaxID=217067 RepID=A0ABU0FMA5_9HYPH|nr:CheR family methyltransferase [Labrys monachus]MDQ0395737.1 chemotaxis protein methyltransferase WspC [Labrys monachus]